MHTTVRSRGPLPRKLSNNEIAVSREVSVVTSHCSDTPATSLSGSTSVRPSVDGFRLDSSASYRANTMTATASYQAGKGHSRPRPVDRPRPAFVQASRYLRDGGAEHDCQSLRELAEFLRNKEPPKSNFMSQPDDVVERNAKSPFSVFGRKRSKRLKQQQMIRLPDSAVAAKTIEGYWHIAISIPYEYDLLRELDTTDAVSQVAGSRRATAGVLHSSREGPITVLKPVKEDRPLSVGQDFNAAEIVSEVFSDAESRDEGLQETPRPQSGLVNHVSPKPPRAYIAVSPDDIRRQDSQRSDQRHSGGTVYSERTIEPEGPALLGAGSMSSSSSMPPTRISSRPPTQSSLDAVMPSTSKGSVSAKEETRGHIPDDAYRKSAQSVPESYRSDRSLGAPLTTNAACTSISSETETGPRPAPTRKLPDLPHAEDDVDSSPGQLLTSMHTSRPTSSTSQRLTDAEMSAVSCIKTMPGTDVEASLDSPTISPVAAMDIEKTARERRQERVKAIRSRDIAGFRARSTPSGSDAIVSPNTVLRSPCAPPSHSTTNTHAGRRSKSASPLPAKRASRSKDCVIRLTNIMLVVDIEPIGEGPVHMQGIHETDDTVRSTGVGISTMQTNRHAQQSASPRPAPVMHLSATETSIPASLSSYQSDTRKRADSSIRRIEAQLTAPIPAAAHDKSEEFEARLARIERYNATMMQTLTAVLSLGKGLGELSRSFPPRTQSSTKDQHDLERRAVEHIGRGLGDIEPLMRELRKASRISMEGERPAIA